VPQIDKAESAFLFDTSVVDDDWYGYEIGARLIPALERDHNCSILSGDLIIADQEVGFSLLAQSAVVRRPCELRDTSQLYAVYINNLTAPRAQALHDRLSQYHPYIGYIPATYYSLVKDWLSAILSSTYLKIGERWICADDDEEDIVEDVDHNIPGWPLEEHGYTCSAIRPMYFDHFLSYKIERAVYPGDEIDTRLALATISSSPKEISSFRVLVESAKAEYLRREKAASLARAGIDHLADAELQAIIADRITRNYIYKLEFKHNRSFFNIMLEFENQDNQTPTRLLAALEYQPQENTLRLVTMY